MIVAKIVKFCGVVRSHLLQAKLKWCRLIWTTVGLLRPSMCLKQPSVTLISSCIGVPVLPVYSGTLTTAVQTRLCIVCYRFGKVSTVDA